MQTIRALSVIKHTNVLRTFCRNATTGAERKRLIILGTGWGSFSVLKQVDKSKYDVIVVSPRNHFLFTPLLCSTTVGTLEFRSIVEPVRNTVFRQTDHFHLSRATGIDFINRVLHVESVLKSGAKYDLMYDKLVIGVGSLSNTFNTPGVKENAFFLKEVADARRIRNKILSNFELATQPSVTPEESERLLHIVIVGGGPTGVEFGAEVYDFVQQDVSRLFKAKKDGNPMKFSARSMLASETVHEDHVHLKSGEKIPCGLVVWSTGLAPRDFVREMDIPKNERGQILTDRNLRVLGDPSGNAFAIGDCADIKDLTLPCTAQVAERQGKYLAQHLNTGSTNKFSFTSAGMLAYIGGYDGLTDVPQTKLRGFPSWFLWRSAYLTKLGSWRLRMQVPLDWTKTLLFGRDVSRFE
ncbi:NDH-like protein [Mya arenaria]|uniref:NDH-like protein n=1 Tax=Mya arenaria TaxID=6604 RepID=A0ABY7DXI7_MYAAR|nr:NDH-like protein [Mya arenaria]